MAGLALSKSQAILQAAERWLFDVRMISSNWLNLPEALSFAMVAGLVGVMAKRAA